MKSVIIERYGKPEVLKIKEIPIPQIENDEILIKVLASSVNPVDWKVRKGMLRIMPGQKLPKMLGADLCGIIEKIGEGVEGFKKGDEVYGMISAIQGGAYAEYVVAKSDQVSLKPSNLKFTEAAGIPLAALTAYQALKRIGNLQVGETVCVNGCSGGVGHFAVQIAKTLGATVTGICSTNNVEFAKGLGADEIIDYTTVDNIFENDNKYDIFFDAVANQSYFNVMTHLNRNGRYLSTLPSASLLLGSIINMISSKHSKMTNVKIKSEDLRFLTELIKASKLKVNIDKVYSLNEIQEAHRHSETGRVVGKLTLKIDQETT